MLQCSTSTNMKDFSVCNTQGNEIPYFDAAVINLHTNSCARILGKPENTRFLHLGLFQGAGKPKQKLDAEMAASDNPMLDTVFVDPILFCTAFKKNRFYMFTQREPDDTHA